MKNLLIILSIMVVVGVAGFFAYGLTVPKNTDPKIVSTGNSPSIQNPKPGTTLVVDYIDMKEGGFVTVRKDDGGNPGKIIGVSILRPPGENKNISIDLSEEVRDGQIVYVLANVDGNNDGMFEFPGPDIPMNDASGNIILTRVNIAGPLTDGQNSSVTENQSKNIVALNEKGFFYPQSLEIKTGESVIFMNTSEFDMWISSDPHPLDNALPGFNQLMAVKAGGKYSYVFTKVGTWRYHNETDPTQAGRVVVK